NQLFHPHGGSGFPPPPGTNARSGNFSNFCFSGSLAGTVGHRAVHLWRAAELGQDLAEFLRRRSRRCNRHLLSTRAEKDSCLTRYPFDDVKSRRTSSSGSAFSRCTKHI